jgi:hypothetical protein
VAKQKAGKAKCRKPVARKPRRQVVRNPAAAAMAAAVPAKTGRSYPCKVIVSKGSERLPVEVKDAAHHAQLVEQFGESSIEVQS